MLIVLAVVAVFAVAGGLLLWSFIKRRAIRMRFRGMSVAELRLYAESHGTSPGESDSLSQTWFSTDFELLLPVFVSRMFVEPQDRESNEAWATAQYVAALAALRGKIERQWPKATYESSANYSFRKSGRETSVLHRFFVQTLTWFAGLARTHNTLAASAPTAASITAWNPDLFARRERARGGGAITLGDGLDSFDLILPGHSHVVTPCTPAALEAEIARLSGPLV